MEVKPPTSVPWAAITACAAFVLGAGLTCGGVFVLAGAGWAMLVGAVPCLVLSLVIFRGLQRAQ